VTIPAFPLQWPAGWKRTPAHQRAYAKFGRKENVAGRSWQSKRDLTIADAVKRVREEAARMGIRDDDLVINTNLKLRMDGLPRSDQREPEDSGAAVYWRDKQGHTLCMAIDRYMRVADNLAAIAATLDAMRAIERHGGGEILNRAFTGFTALPGAGATTHWRDVLDVPPGATREQIEQAYRRLRSLHHPDRGGDASRFHEIQKAFEEADEL
jgi:hypothetical protein